MKMDAPALFARTAVLAVALPLAGFCMVPTPALAQSVSAPSAASGPMSGIVSAELMPGWRTPSGTHMAALRLRLADRWKTYWRAPGEAGIPPAFDWSGSENLRSVAYHWPEPHVFDLNGLRTVGYTQELVLPIEITPEHPGQPIRIAAEVELGVCKDICVPVSLRLDSVLANGGKPDPAIRAALADVPRPAREAGLSAIRCEVAPLSDGLRVTARMELPALGGREFVVFEPRDPSIWVGETVIERNGRSLVAAADFVPPSGAPFALDRSGIRITLMGESGAVELQGCPG